MTVAAPRTKKKIIAIFIAYNASRTLERFYRTFPTHLVDEVILVDDCSKDDTYDIAKRLRITAYRNSVNLGYGGNLKRAIAIALEHGADIIIDLHPDSEYSPSAIAPAIEETMKGAALVLGKRFDRITDLAKRGMYFWKIPPLMLMSAIQKAILRTRISDLHQGFRVYTRGLLEKILFERGSNDYIFSFEVIVQAIFNGLPIAEVPVETAYTGKKRGASLKSSVKYSLETVRVLALFLLAKLGMRTGLFASPRRRFSERVRSLAHPVREKRA